MPTDSVSTALVGELSTLRRIRSRPCRLLESMLINASMIVYIDDCQCKERVHGHSSSSCSPRSAARRARRRSTARKPPGWRPGSRRSPIRPGCSCCISCRPPTAARPASATSPPRSTSRRARSATTSRSWSQAGLLERERRGTWAWYRLVPDALTALAGTLTVPAERSPCPPGRRLAAWISGSPTTRTSSPGARRGLGRATAEVLVAEGARVVISSRSQESVDDDRRRPRVGRRSGSPPTTPTPRPRPAWWPPPATTSGASTAPSSASAGHRPARSSERTDDEWRAAFDSVFLGALRLATTVADALTYGGSIAFVLSTSVKAPIAEPGHLQRPAPRPRDGRQDPGRRARPARHPRQRPHARADRHRSRAGAGRQLRRRRRRQGEDRWPAFRLGATASPSEFGRAAAFLLSPASGYLTGVMLPVDGGLTRAL